MNVHTYYNTVRLGAAVFSSVVDELIIRAHEASIAGIMKHSALEHAIDELRAATHSAASTAASLASQQAELIKQSRRYDKVGEYDDTSGAQSPNATAMLLWGSGSDASYPLEGKKRYDIGNGKGGKQDEEGASLLVGPWRQGEQRRVSARIHSGITHDSKRRRPMMIRSMMRMMV